MSNINILVPQFQPHIREMIFAEPDGKKAVMGLDYICTKLVKKKIK